MRRAGGREPASRADRDQAEGGGRPGSTSDMLVVNDLARAYGGVRAVDGVSFSVPAGSMAGLIGPNGAGKSTVVGMIAGAIRPDRGEILLDGQGIAGWSPVLVARRGVIRTFQTASVSLVDPGRPPPSAWSRSARDAGSRPPARLITARALGQRIARTAPREAGGRPVAASPHRRATSGRRAKRRRFSGTGPAGGPTGTRRVTRR